MCAQPDHQICNNSLWNSHIVWICRTKACSVVVWLHNLYYRTCSKILTNKPVYAKLCDSLSIGQNRHWFSKCEVRNTNHIYLITTLNFDRIQKNRLIICSYMLYIDTQLWKRLVFTKDDFYYCKILRFSILKIFLLTIMVFSLHPNVLRNDFMLLIFTI